MTPAHRPPPGPDDDLRVARRLYELGAAAWPHIALDFTSFARHLARHGAGDPPSESVAADVYLACACAEGAPGAPAALEPTFAGSVARAVASVDGSPAFVDEILQGLREKLLVRQGGRAGKIADYAGRASLRSWLCAVAVRSAISARRRKSEQGHEAFAACHDGRLAGGGPEIEYLRARYKHAFEDAVRSAVARLPSKARLLLRLHLVDGMGIDQLGALYGVGRSTAARWLAAARRALLDDARRELHARVRLSSTELESLAADLRSQLDVSIRRLLLRSGTE